MALFFLTTLAIGVVVLTVQLVLGLVGADGDHTYDHGGDHDGLDLFTVRALAAAAAAFGVLGVVTLRTGVPSVVALLVAGVGGVAAAAGVASTMRAMRRLEVDKSFDIAMTLGQEATVSLGIPGGRSGEGKVHLVAQSRFLELHAVTAEGDLPTGTTVTVIDTLSSDTVVVSRTPLLLEDPQ